MTVADLGLILRLTVAGVMTAAAVGKVVPLRAWRDALVAGVELVAAGLLVLTETARLGEAVFVLVALSYMLYAVRQPDDATCSCFGSLLPRTSRRAQLVRNCVLLVGAITAPFLPVTVAGPNPFPITWTVDLALALAFIAAIVGLPWLATWAYVGPAGLREPSQHAEAYRRAATGGVSR